MYVLSPSLDALSFANILALCKSQNSVTCGGNISSKMWQCCERETPYKYSTLSQTE